MKIRYSEEVDILYISLVDAEIADSEYLENGIIVDYDKNNRVVGMEFLSVSKRWPLSDVLKFSFEAAYPKSWGKPTVSEVEK